MSVEEWTDARKPGMVAQDMGALVMRIQARARNMRVQGACRLRPSSTCVQRLQHSLTQSRLLGADAAQADDALRMLVENGAQVEALIQSAVNGARTVLPASGARARILAPADEIIAGGEVALTRERLLPAVRAFDEVQPLMMREIMQMPAALEVAILTALSRVAREIVGAAQQRRAAEKWINVRRASLPAGARELFWERALQLSIEQELPRKHAALMESMAAAHQRSEWVIERAHRICAYNRLRLEQLLAALRYLAQNDWQECYMELSAAEAELAADPSGVYGNMTRASQGALREALAGLARELHSGETTLARHAIRAAAEGRARYGAEDPRAGVCYWLYTDAGRSELADALGAPRPPRRRVPDASGRKSVALLAGTVALCFALIGAAIGDWLLLPLGIPLAWHLAERMIARFYPLRVHPRRMLRLRLESLPDAARTLVALPVLLSSPARAREIISHMETLGCMEKDPNIEFLLLGDFRDAAGAREHDDEAILAAARAGVAQLNARVGWEKYHYLHRVRDLRPRDARWMGEGRKRGALRALNGLLLQKEGAEEAFSAEGACAQRLGGRFAYVLTLDADTQMLPGTVHRLVGTLAHPLNRRMEIDGKMRGYAVLQPAMETLPRARENAYAALTMPAGGVNSYPVTLSDFYQDMTDNGCFAGKGIYAVRAFAEATEGKLPEEEILSHDLIEGILCGAGFLNDSFLYDGVPNTLRATLTRLHRWTRGDWQLVRVLLAGKGLRAQDRMKLLANLLRSLYVPALAGLLIHSVWLDRPGALALALLFSYLPALFHPQKNAWRKASYALAILPITAAVQVDAILRALYRLLISRKHLLDWVPAADAGGKSVRIRMPGRIAAILLLPGLLNAYWLPAVLALAVLFLVAPAWTADLESEAIDAGETLSRSQIACLNAEARRIWLFFEKYVPLSGCGLPPDNVQVDPRAEVAQRTSPTNIGLYMMSCLAACELGFIREDALRARLCVTVATLERLEKWHGQLYNWYDINDMRPLKPRYVSSVDSGNLAGALLLCAQAVSKDVALSARMRTLVTNMHLAQLYDSERELFYIGMDVESGCMSTSHYDLYASEARILSFAAIMMGEVPLRHWRRLARMAVRVEGRQALLSWGGTMFEYLMPELILKSSPQTLSGESRRAVVRYQMAQGRLLKRPWGVSESGYYAFDMHLNYQYRAFGLRQLALNGSAVQDVVAPYASLLALCEAPAAVADNLAAMEKLGWMGQWGPYEAADYLRREVDGSARLVCSHMAHHQGMALCALANALSNDVLSKMFFTIPEARALEPLLEEKPGVRLRVPRRREVALPLRVDKHRERRFVRTVNRTLAVESHLLHAAGTSLLATARGQAFIWTGGLQLNRFDGGLLRRGQGMTVHLRDGANGAERVLGASRRAEFDAGCVRYRERIGALEAELDLCISPESGAVIQYVTVKNLGDTARHVRLTSVLAVALATQRDMRAHATFQNMFIHSEAPDERTLLFTRRARNGDAAHPLLAHTVWGGENVQRETSMEQLTGRDGALDSEGGLHPLGGTTGWVLNPASALCVDLDLAGGETGRVHFALLCASEDTYENCRKALAGEDAPLRAAKLADTQARALMDFASIDPPRYRLLQRATAILCDARLHPARNGETAPREAEARTQLFQTGISGELPIIVMVIADVQKLGAVREVIQMHEFYRMMGLAVDLALVDDYGNSYDQPVHTALEDLIASGHLNDLRGVPGGVYLLDRRQLEPGTMRALERAAALRFSAAQDAYAQLRTALDAAAIHTGSLPLAMCALPNEEGEEGKLGNGYGSFVQDSYCIKIGPAHLPPAPWCNILANDRFGALFTDRGGGYAWHQNSRSGRLTAFPGDVLRENWGWMFYVSEPGGRYIRLLPGLRPMTDFTVEFNPDFCRYAGATEELAFAVEMRLMGEGLGFTLRLKNRAPRTLEWKLTGFVDWLMGTDAADEALLRTWNRLGAGFASGSMPGVGYFACDAPDANAGGTRADFLREGDAQCPAGLMYENPRRGGWTLETALKIERGGERTVRFVLGAAADIRSAYARVRSFRSGIESTRVLLVGELCARLRLETPDAAINYLANGWLQAQVLSARVLGRTGFYQPGGAYGFRDQLQDMLPLIYYDPQRVRRHLLYAAARQFAAGDVLHWWHDPYDGVRTRIRDDSLFLPFVTAAYVQSSGDTGVLDVCVPYLEDCELPDDREDVYAQMRPSALCEPLHAHCMRALRRGADFGAHGLCRMGGGDWNDGMNRVGIKGEGESVWLSEFLIVCADDYRGICTEEGDKIYLAALADQLRGAIEAHGWDGNWYLRAYDDSGTKLGGADCACCQIDLISQAWAVLAGLNRERCRTAMESAWTRLVDEEAGIVRLLDPPFDGVEQKPGYIAAYPPGVRENGGQYTHAACWFALALARMGDAARAHRVVELLLPSGHSADAGQARNYHLEPYVMAADIYTNPQHYGRGGWSWYTGSAAWMLLLLLALAGYERCGNRVRLKALMGQWERVSVTVQYGQSQYRLVTLKDTRAVLIDGEEAAEDFIEMVDDGQTHTVVFPPRASEWLPVERTLWLQTVKT